MKLLTFIFGLYVLMLNAFPCTDADVFTDDARADIVSISHIDHNHSGFDLCPPFCTCHCCHVHTVDFGSVVFEPVGQYIPSKVFLHFDSLGEEPISSLLDPPRV